MNSLQCERCIVIPDVHQDVAWVRRIFERECVSESRDRVVFLGDYFDTRKCDGEVAGVAETCAFLLETREALGVGAPGGGGRCVFLLGNHDIQYFEAKSACDARRTPRQVFHKCGSAFSNSTAKKVAKGLPEEFWKETKLFAAVNGWLLSHAGLMEGYWPVAESVEKSLKLLDAECAGALASMRKSQQRLLAAGVARGGDFSLGGITWLDWRDEFADALPLPQIVGHTGCFAERGRRNGRSWCIDGCQTCYGVLTGAEFEVREV